MFLQLLTLAVAADADSNARSAAGYAKEGRDAALGSKDGVFLTFDEVDYNYEYQSTKWYKPNVAVSTGKNFTRRCIPASRIKEMVETTLRWSNNDQGLNSHWNRISHFHKDKLVLIKTFDGEYFFLEGTLQDLHSHLNNT